MTQVIYKIVNLVNDKFYIGSTTNKKVRFREHRKQLRGNRHHCKHLQASWNKYGEEKFDFRVVEEVPEPQSLAEAEDKWLKEHFGKPYCYNSGAAAVAPWRGIYGAKHPNFGNIMSEDQRKVISATLKAFYAEDITNHPRFGKRHTEETRERIRQKKLANPTRAWLDKDRSEETKAKIGAAQRGKPKGPGRRVSPEGMAKIRAAVEAGRYSHWRGRNHTEEAKAKMSKTVFVKPDGILFPSLTLVLKYYNIKMPTLNRALKSGRPITRGKLKGYEFSYGGIGAEPSENDLALIRHRVLDTRPQTE